MSLEAQLTERLLREAARAPRAALPDPSPRLIDAVMVARREILGGREVVRWLGSLRTGFALACALTVLACVLNLPGALPHPEDALNSWNTIARVEWVP